MKKIFAFTVCLVMVFIASCQSATPTPFVPSANVLFESNVGVEYTGVTISFEHPREWQTGYFSDSGAYGWVIADADPNEVFWERNTTGNEIVFILMGGEEAKPDTSPSQLIQEMGNGSVEGITEIIENDKQAAYVVNAGELRAAIILNQKTFSLFGSYPNDKETAVRNGLETILRSLTTHDAKDLAISNNLAWGTRNEGLVIAGTTRDGYAPLASISMWTIDGKANQEILVTIDSNTPESQITFDITDKDGKSILPEGAISFSGKLESEKITLPDSGVYSIQIYPSPDSQWYGSYKIEIK